MIILHDLPRSADADAPLPAVGRKTEILAARIIAIIVTRDDVHLERRVVHKHDIILARVIATVPVSGGVRRWTIFLVHQHGTGCALLVDDSPRARAGGRGHNE